MELRSSALFLAGALIVLVLSGCLGSQGTSVQEPSEQAPPQPAQPPSQAQPAPQQPGGSLGDADISASDSEDEAELPEEDLVPPPYGGAASDLSDLDIDLGAMDEDYVISDEDIVEPA